jgi:hypothetical protein
MIHLFSKSGLLDQQHCVCETCGVSHGARSDRIDQEYREFVLRHRGHSTHIKPEWWHFLFGHKYKGNANIKQAFGGDSSITITLASLASSATGARESTAIDNSSNLYLDALVRLHFKLQTGSPANDQQVYIYCYGSEDGTNYTDNATGSDAGLTLRAPTNLRLIGTIATPTSGGLTYKSHPIPVAVGFGGIMPVKWGIVVNNFTGVTGSATEGDHAKAYNGVYSTAV